MKKKDARANTKGPDQGSVEKAAQAIKKSQDEKKDADTGTGGEGGTGQEGGDNGQPGEGTGTAGPEIQNQGEGGSAEGGAGAEGHGEGAGAGEAGQAGSGSETGEGGGTGQEGGEGKGDNGGTGEGEGAEGGEEDQDKEQIPTPVPNAEQIEHSAQFMAENPDLLEACRKTVTRAEQIIKEKAKGPKKTAEELAADAHDRLVKVYGKDFVTAQKGNNRGYYSRKAWNQMKNKRGWEEVTPTMPELQAAPAAEPKADDLDAE